MKNDLCTTEQIQESEKLHAGYKRAREVRERQQPLIDKLQLAFEEAGMRLMSAQRGTGTAVARIQELEAVANEAERERDRAVREADGPVFAARDLMAAHDRRLVTAACGWLGHLEREYDWDTELVAMCRGARKEMDYLLRRHASLREIVDYFDPIRIKIENWKMRPEPARGYISGQAPRRFFTLPRIDDFLR